LLLADQLLQRIEVLHENGYIHRDLKPENILMGLEDNASTLYLIDYGLAKKWK
jgi:casein kinase 1 epsilon